MLSIFKKHEETGGNVKSHEEMARRAVKNHKEIARRSVKEREET